MIVGFSATGQASGAESIIKVRQPNCQRKIGAGLASSGLEQSIRIEMPQDADDELEVDE